MAGRACTDAVSKPNVIAAKSHFEMEPDMSPPIFRSAISLDIGKGLRADARRP
ncbi:hypothetical protein GCM10009077_23740 [Roseibium denhamense]